MTTKEEALKHALTTIRAARAWILPKNLDPTHHHYDPRAVRFAEQCDDTIARILEVVDEFPMTTTADAHWPKG